MDEGVKKQNALRDRIPKGVLPYVEKMNELQKLHLIQQHAVACASGIRVHTTTTHIEHILRCHDAAKVIACFWYFQDHRQKFYPALPPSFVGDDHFF